MNITLPRIIEETQLVEFSEDGRSFQLHPEALKAWEEMKTKAISYGVQLRIVSAFRSVNRQAEIIGEKSNRVGRCFRYSFSRIGRFGSVAGISEERNSVWR